jgi:hypothetical protein
VTQSVVLGPMERLPFVIVTPPPDGGLLFAAAASL